MPALGWVIVAAIAFVGNHFLLSHPLRAPLVARIGERGFLGLYSAVAAATLLWLALAYRATPPEAPLWPVGDVLWAVGTALMLGGSILFVGSLLGNPAFPDPSGTPKAVPEPRGVFAITRHPMMWGFAIWGAVHLAVFPTPSNMVLSGAIVVLALVGAHLQDRKKARLQPEVWRTWRARTSYWPFASPARVAGFRPHDLAGGVLLWLVASWAHIPLADWPAGIWKWIA